MVSTNKVSVEPTHTGLLLEATGVIGVELTVTMVVLSILVQPFTVTVTE